MTTINASFKDMIELIQYRQQQLVTKEFDKKLIECEYGLESVSISFIKELLNNNSPENCKFVSYWNMDDDSSSCSLIVNRHLTEQEKQKEIEHCKGNLEYGKHKLLKWMEKPEWKDQILTYLEHYNIKIEGIN